MLRICQSSSRETEWNTATSLKEGGQHSRRFMMNYFVGRHVYGRAGGSGILVVKFGLRGLSAS